MCIIVREEYSTSGKTNKSIIKDYFFFLFIFVFLITGCRFIFTKLIINTIIQSSSMESTIMSADHIIGYRLAYKSKIPHRGDIIIFPNPDDNTVLYIKRIIGLPGEQITIEKGNVLINAHALVEDYLYEPMAIEKKTIYNVPQNAYFVMGDNRNYSNDARYWDNAFVYKDNIIAKAIFKWYPGILAYKDKGDVNE